jgi:UDP-N-acetylmuramoyl-tripeptide--D-alanyl-D-alanine ligase
MTQQALWSGLSLVGALNARVSGGLPREVTGVSIDTRTLQRGDLFFAIQGDTLDGHDYVRAALKQGAAAAVIDEAHSQALLGAGALFVVRDVQQALERLGARARERSGAYIAAITGSVGKTSTKDMARVIFSKFGETHASAASYNNHWGVPLSLARMPTATRYGVFEVGMNHAGEIARLVQFVKPHVAIVTRIAPVHLEHFASVDAIADAKSEIFQGLVEGGVAILNRDDDSYERLAAIAAEKSGHVFNFGAHAGAQARLLSYDTVDGVGLVEAEIFGRRLSYIIGAPGRHIAQNSLSLLLTAYVFDVDLEQAAAALEGFTPPAGRGQRETVTTSAGAFTLIDESYNANPTSMRAALELLAATQPGDGGRRIVALGDMLELGPRAAELHGELANDIVGAHVDLLFTAGPNMQRLFYAAPETMRGAHRATAMELEDAVISALRPGDVLMVKGSNGSRMARIVAAARSKAAPDLAAPGADATN